MATKRPKKRKPQAPPERRVDVTRMEYEDLLSLAQRNRESIQRLEMEAATEFKRTVEQQAEIDALKKAVFKKLAL
jgi:hypothetical protein